MSIFILSNRKIIRNKGENVDSFSNDEYSLPNFRIARCNVDDIPEPTGDKKNTKTEIFWITPYFLNQKIMDIPKYWICY